MKLLSRKSYLSVREEEKPNLYKGKITTKEQGLRRQNIRIDIALNLTENQEANKDYDIRETTLLESTNCYI